MKRANPRRSDLQNTTRNTRRRPSLRQAAKPRGDDRQQGGAGNARRNYERYIVLAREAALSGDQVEMENCYQHAEHYYRVFNRRE